MKVAVCGARERKSEEDCRLVVAQLEVLRKKYSNLVVISQGCDRGIGAFVKAHCLQDKTTYRFVEAALRIFADLAKPHLVQLYMARNAWALESAEEFHVYVTEGGGGTMDDLIKRAVKTRLPVYVYKPGQVDGRLVSLGDAMIPTVHGSLRDTIEILEALLPQMKDPAVREDNPYLTDLLARGWKVLENAKQAL